MRLIGKREFERVAARHGRGDGGVFCGRWRIHRISRWPRASRPRRHGFSSSSWRRGQIFWSGGLVYALAAFHRPPGAVSLPPTKAGLAREFGFLPEARASPSERPPRLEVAQTLERARAARLLVDSPHARRAWPEPSWRHGELQWQVPRLTKQTQRSVMQRAGALRCWGLRAPVRCITRPTCRKQWRSTPQFEG